MNGTWLSGVGHGLRRFGFALSITLFVVYGVVELHTGRPLAGIVGLLLAGFIFMQGFGTGLSNIGCGRAERQRIKT